MSPSLYPVYPSRGSLPRHMQLACVLCVYALCVCSMCPYLLSLSMCYIHTLMRVLVAESMSPMAATAASTL
jgi:hypothetical protein